MRPQQRHPRGALQEAVQQPGRQSGDEAPASSACCWVFARGAFEIRDAASSVAREGSRVVDEQGDS